MNGPAVAVVGRVSEDLGPMAANHQEYEMLYRALRSGEHAYDIVPSVLPRMIRQESWMQRYDRNTDKRHILGPDEFIRFIVEKPPVGLGTTLDNCRKYLGEGNPDRVAFELMVDRGRGGKNNPTGRNQHSEVNDSNRMIDQDEYPAMIPIPSTQDGAKPREGAKQGTTIEYAVRRIGRAAAEDPERFGPIRDRLMAGEVSANAAMIEAGFKPRTIALPLDPEAAVRLLVRHFQGEALEALIHGLANWAGIELAEQPIGGGR